MVGRKMYHKFKKGQIVWVIGGVKDFGRIGGTGSGPDLFAQGCIKGDVIPSYPVYFIKIQFKKNFTETEYSRKKQEKT